MTDLAEFLLLRIAEDEADARAAIGTAAFQQQTGRWIVDKVQNKYGSVPIVFALADGGGMTQVANLEAAWRRNERGRHIARWDPARVLAECDAKRLIIEEHRRDEGTSDPCGAHDPEYRTIPCLTLLALALPYAAHPDFKEEWRP